MKKVVFLKNALILTVTSLILRFIGIVFKVWLAGKIGSEGIGLYQLVFSVYLLAATFATSGISTAVTRLVTDELALGSKSGVLRIMRRCVALTLIIAAVSTGAVYTFAKPIAAYALNDMRSVYALKILSFSLPFMGISSCIKGYFIARRRALPNSVAQLFEQLIRIAVVVFAVCRFAPYGLSYTCGAVMLGDTVAEVASMLLISLVYRHDKKHLSVLTGRQAPPYGITREIMRITLPISGGRYLNTALRTLENMMVPASLLKFGMANEAALSQFGMIKGMALPVLFFPSSLLGALSTLLIPEICEAKAKNQPRVVAWATKRCIKITALSGYLFGGLFMMCGQRIGVLVYNDYAVGELITALAPLVPLMYLDSVCDGILKGLDQQAFTFRNSFIDSAMRIALVWFFVPLYGMRGFLAIMYLSNLFTAIMNVGRLLNVTGVRLHVFTGIILPVILSGASCYIIKSLLCLLALPNIMHVMLMIVLGSVLYLSALRLCGVVDREELLSLFRV